INDETKEVKLCSVYRDTYLDRGEGSYGKANAAYAKGGPEQAISMLNKNLDLGIKKYVTVDFKAVTECVDALGGVELDITEEELQWINSYIETTADVTGKKANFISSPGKQLCDGTQATAYARIRYTTGDDYKRAERQRIVIEQMFAKAKTSNISSINKVVNSMFDEISTNLTKKEILALASFAFEYKMAETTGFPFEKNGKTVGSKGSCVIPCDLESNVKQLHEYLYNDTEYTLSATVEEITNKIINDTGLHQGDGY
ncbi:MAG: LCP family protein, partial [Lachnospiraceae bacterium]